MSKTLWSVTTFEKGTLVCYSDKDSSETCFYDENNSLKLDQGDKKVHLKKPPVSVDNPQGFKTTTQVTTVSQQEIREHGKEVSELFQKARIDREKIKNHKSIIEGQKSGYCQIGRSSSQNQSGPAFGLSVGAKFHPPLSRQTRTTSPLSQFNQFTIPQGPNAIDPARCSRADADVPQVSIPGINLERGIRISVGGHFERPVFSALGLLNEDYLDVSYKVLNGPYWKHIDFRPTIQTPTVPTIKEIVGRLDLLDGVTDQQFFDIPLSRGTSTASCQLHEMLNSTTTWLLRPDGTGFLLDCRQLRENLILLIEILEKLPNRELAKLMFNDTNLKLPPPEEAYTFFLINTMVYRFLFGQPSDVSIQQIFSKSKFSGISGVLRDIGNKAQKSVYQKFNVNDANEAYKILERMGKKYGFDVTIFKPQHP